MNLFITRVVWASLIAISVGVSASDAALLAYYVDGTDADGAALAELAGNAAVTATSLNNVGFLGGGNITRVSWGSAGATPAGPTAGSGVGSEWLLSRGSDTQATPGTNTDYYEFTVTANAGFIDLSTLTFDWTLAADDTGGGLISNYEVFVAANGGSYVSLGTGNQSIATGIAAFTPVLTEVIDLSSLDLAKSFDVLIALGDNSGSGGKATFIQGIQLEGKVVPEPGTMLLTVAGLAGLVCMRRRRRRTA